MATAAPYPEDDPERVPKKPDPSPAMRAVQGVRDLRGGSAHEPIRRFPGAAHFVVHPSFLERLKLHLETRQEVADKGFSLRGIPLEPLPDLLRVIDKDARFSSNPFVHDGSVGALNNSASECLQQLKIMLLLEATDSGEPNLETPNGTI